MLSILRDLNIYMNVSKFFNLFLLQENRRINFSVRNYFSFKLSV